MAAPVSMYSHQNQFYLANSANEYLDTIITHIQNLADVCYVHLYVESNFIQPHEPFHIVDNLGNRFELHIGRIIRNPYFDRIYAYDGKDLGCTYRPAQSTFKV